MNIDEIKKNAPRKATHYRNTGFGIRYYRIFDGAHLWYFNYWIESEIDIKKLKPL